MNNKYEARPIEPVIINGIKFTQADFVCLARKMQEYMRITSFGEPVDEVYMSGCCNCPYAKEDCANIVAVSKVAQLTGTYFSVWEGKDGKMCGLPDEYKKPKELIQTEPTKGERRYPDSCEEYAAMVLDRTADVQIFEKSLLVTRKEVVQKKFLITPESMETQDVFDENNKLLTTKVSAVSLLSKSLLTRMVTNGAGEDAPIVGEITPLDDSLKCRYEVTVKNK